MSLPVNYEYCFRKARNNVQNALVLCAPDRVVTFLPFIRVTFRRNNSLLLYIFLF